MPTISTIIMSDKKNALTAAKMVFADVVDVSRLEEFSVTVEKGYTPSIWKGIFTYKLKKTVGQAEMKKGGLK